jgi:hypothetical protein
MDKMHGHAKLCRLRSVEDEIWWEFFLLSPLIDSRALSSTLNSNFDESFHYMYVRDNIQSTLMQPFDRGMSVEKTLMQTLASQLSCNSRLAKQGLYTKHIGDRYMCYIQGFHLTGILWKYLPFNYMGHVPEARLDFNVIIYADQRCAVRR